MPFENMFALQIIYPEWQHLESAELSDKVIRV